MFKQVVIEYRFETGWTMTLQVEESIIIKSTHMINRRYALAKANQLAKEHGCKALEWKNDGTLVNVSCHHLCQLSIHPTLTRK